MSNRSTRTISGLVALVACGLTSQLDGNDVHTVVDRDAHANGVVLLRITFPSRGEVWSVRLDTSLDGQEFREAGIGLPRANNLFRSMSYHDERTTVLVPAIAWFRRETLFFDEPGMYWFRWEISFRDESKPRTVPHQRDKTVEAVVADQVVEVAPPTRVDLDFIAGLADPGLIRAMFGDDFFERQHPEALEKYLNNSEMLAVKVIASFLEATRDQFGGSSLISEKSPEKLQARGRHLWALAKELPDSSYAPYAAHYAACCFALVGGKEINTVIHEKTKGGASYIQAARRLRPDLIKGQPEMDIARDAFTFAATRGDAYVKPLALYHLAVYQAEMGEADEAERLLTKAEAVVPGRGRIEKWGDKVRTQIEEIRQFQAKAPQPSP